MVYMMIWNILTSVLVIGNLQHIPGILHGYRTICAWSLICRLANSRSQNVTENRNKIINLYVILTPVVSLLHSLSPFFTSAQISRTACRDAYRLPTQQIGANNINRKRWCFLVCGIV